MNGDSPSLPASVLDAVPAAICLVGSDGFILQANRAWRQQGTDVGDSVLGVLDGQGRQAAPALASGLRGVISGKQPEFSMDYARGENGGERVYRLTVVPADEDGGCVVVMLTDIGGGRAVPREDEHTLQAQKMEAVGRLAGGVAHDFNNLLTLISGYTEILLARVAASDPCRPEIEEIRKAANRGAGLTTQLLAFSRRQKVEPRVLDLNQLVSDMERMLRRMIGEDVSLAAELGPGLGKVTADPGQLGQVIMNLVLNARDAMPRGGRITIRTFNCDVSNDPWLTRGSYVCLGLEDTGQGMDAETLQHLFEPFFTTKDPGKGTGLGLSTVYGIVKQNHGDVRVESQPGRGSQFLIFLPRTEDGAEPASGRDPSPALTAGTETVLLVEDEASVRRLLKHVLSKEGYQVLEASSGEEAIEIYQRHDGPIHLLLTDMVMPLMNGRELADELSRRQASLRVLYVSGYTDDVLIRNGALGPGMYFLQKPLRPQVLTAKVREVLDA